MSFGTPAQDTGAPPGLNPADASSPLDFQHLWLLRHLQGIERNGQGGLSAGLTFNLSLLPGDINDALNATGQSPKSESGNAFGEFLQSATDQHAPTTPIADMLTYQSKLQHLGYLPADYSPTGAYDPATSQASFRYGSDLTQASIQGSGGFLTTPAGKGLDYLGSTMPSGIVKGFVGMLKGLWGTVKDVIQLPTNPTEFTQHWGRDLFNIVGALSMFDGLGEVATALRLAAPTEEAIGAAADSLEALKAAKTTQLGMFTSRPMVAIAKAISEPTGDAMETWFRNNGVNALLTRTTTGQVASGIYGGLARATVLPRALAIFEPHSQMGKDYRAAYKVPWYIDLPVGLAIHPEGGLLPDAPLGENTILGRALRKTIGPIDPYKMLGMETPTADEDLWHSVQAKSRADAMAELSKDPSWRTMSDEDRAYERVREQGRIIKKLRSDPAAYKTYAEKAGQWSTSGEGLGAKLAYLQDMQGDAKAQALWGAPSQNMQKLIDSEGIAHGIDTRFRVGPGEKGIPGTALQGQRVYIERIGKPANSAAIRSMLNDIAQDPEAIAGYRRSGELQMLLGDRSLAWGPDRIESALRDRLEWSAEDLSNHAGIYPEEIRALRDNGYYPVIVNENILPYGDVSALGASAPAYSRNQFMSRMFGVRDLKDLQGWTQATTLNSWNERLHAWDQGRDIVPYGYGRVLMDQVTQDVRANRLMLTAEGMETPGVRGWAARLAGKNMTVSEFQVASLQRMLENAGVDEESSFSLAKGLHQDALRGYAAPGIPHSPESSFEIVHQLAQALRIHGLPGIPEMIRSIALPGEKFAFMPENMMKFARALRFQLNPMFAARQFFKQQVLGAVSEGLTPVADAAERIAKMGIREEVATLAARKGNQLLEGDDDLMRVLGGTNMRQRDAFNDWRVYKTRYRQAIESGADETTADNAAFAYIKDNSYKWSAGYGKVSPATKSVNYVFFPFMFERKFLSEVGQWMASEPARAFLIQHAAQRYNDLNTMDQYGRRRFSTLIKRYAPILTELNQLNAFSHGIGPGEFVGKDPAALALGAVYGPLAETLGHPQEALQGLLHPVAINSEDAVRFQGIGGRLVPALNAFSDFFHNLNEQKNVAVSPQHETTAGQFDDYFTLRRSLQERYIQLGTAFGAAPTISSFQNNAVIPEVIKEQYLQELQNLDNRYPLGATRMQSLSSSVASADIAKELILAKVSRSRPEDGVVALEAQLAQFQAAGLITSSGRSEGTLAGMMEQQVVNGQMRDLGVRLLERMSGGDMREFVQLWKTLGYQAKYGPIQQTDVPVGEEEMA